MEPPSIVNALAAVMAELPAISKDDKSPEGYSYRGIEAITKHLQPLLAKHSVVIVPSATLQNVVPSPAMKDGWQDVYLNVSWRIYGPRGDHLEAHTCGIGRDRADKGVNKAQTQAYKYLLLHLLSIADKADDSDGHTYEAERRELSPAEALFERVRATKGTPMADTLKALALEDGKALTANALAADEHWAALVSATLEEAS